MPGRLSARTLTHDEETVDGEECSMLEQMPYHQHFGMFHVTSAGNSKMQKFPLGEPKRARMRMALEYTINAVIARRPN